MSKPDYTIDELRQSHSFQRFVNGTASLKEINQWDSWIEESWENRRKAKQATKKVAGFEFKNLVQYDTEEEWSQLLADTIDNTEKETPQLISPISISNKWMYRIAVILILGFGVGAGIYSLTDVNKTSTQLEQIIQERTIKTGPDEQKTLKFSNGSTVVLNSNSTITYNLGLIQGRTIQVVLEGEAYFVAETDSRQNEAAFLIRTPDGEIRDIGTKFLVTVKKDHSKVVLQEGKVEVDTKSREGSTTTTALQQGEMLNFNQHKLLTKKTVNSSFYTSWATGSLEFNQTTMKEIAGFIEHQYDVKVNISDSALADIEIDGGVYFKSLSEMIQAVSEVTKTSVYRSEDGAVIYIENRNKD